MINRSTTRDTPNDPMALYLVALLFGTLVAETILASVHVRVHQQAGHMGASDLIKTLQIHLARRGPSTYGSWTAPVLGAHSPNSGTRCRGAVHSNRPGTSASSPRPTASTTTPPAIGSMLAGLRSGPPGRCAPTRAATTFRSSWTIRRSTRRIYADLFDDEDGDGHTLIWSRAHRWNGD